MNVGSIDFIHTVPDATRNYSQNWVYSDVENQFAMAQTEYDVAPDWTIYGAIGGQHSHEWGTLGAPKVLDDSGNALIGRLDSVKYIDGLGISEQRYFPYVCRYPIADNRNLVNPFRVIHHRFAQCLITSRYSDLSCRKEAESIPRGVAGTNWRRSGLTVNVVKNTFRR